MLQNYLIEKETERLIIRPLDRGDAIAWQEFVMDEVATKYFPDEWKLSPEKSGEWIDFQLKRYEENRYGLQALVDKKSGELIGQCGLLAQTIDNIDELEIGYHLIPRFWGNGYAIEAAKEFKKIGFENNLAESIISIIDPENILSQSVAERNGMTRDTKTWYMEMEVFIYRIKREAYYKTAPNKI